VPVRFPLILPAEQCTMGPSPGATAYAWSTSRRRVDPSADQHHAHNLFDSRS
jgi:hypothetical protein